MSAKPGPKMTKALHDDVLEVVRQHSSPFVSTTDVAEEFPDTTRRTVQKRLNDLQDEGKIVARDVGSNNRIWWDPDQVPPSATRPSSVSQ